MSLTDLYNEFISEEEELEKVASEEDGVEEEAENMINTAEQYVEAGRQMARQEWTAMEKMAMAEIEESNSYEELSDITKYLLEINAQ